MFLNYLGEPLQPSKIKNILNNRVYVKDCDFEGCEANESCPHSKEKCNGGFDNEYCGIFLMERKNAVITV